MRNKKFGLLKYKGFVFFQIVLMNILNIFDIMTTKIGLGNGREEKNPVAYMFSTIDDFLIAKIFIFLIISILILYNYFNLKWDFKKIMFNINVYNSIYLLVIINNLWIIYQNI